MNADVTFFPAVHPWTKIPNTSSPYLTVQNSFCSTSERMEPGGRRVAQGEPDPFLHQLDSQLDFFHKLGYSTAEVQAVQKKYGPTMDTDKVLGELVRIGAGTEVAKQGPVTVSVLVPRGDIRTPSPTLLIPVTVTSPQSREEISEDKDALRPIVIDGSNVAMR